MFDIIRDPLWNNISLDHLALRLVDTRAFQRLRYVRQLGLAYLVYPGATHTRFEHALGTWHLAGRTLAMLQARGDLPAELDRDARIVAAAALLHDIGHYPFSHALEEIGAPHHEDVAGALLTRGEIAEVLRESIAPDAPERVVELIRGRSASPLQGLISGSLDLDKIEYLKRDALMCGVPYGEIDVDRLIHSLTLVADPTTGRTTIGVAEKGLSALESLLFAKYQMYRNVYWHHAVRSATAMYKRLVADAIRSGALRVSELASFSDESLLHQLEERAPSPLLRGLRERRLFKRAFECPSADLTDGAGEWIANDKDLVAAAEDQLAREVGLAPGELLLDYPVKTQMLDLNMPVLRRNGIVKRLTGDGLDGSINLPRLSEELYRSARWLRVFVARPVEIDRRAVIALAARSERDVRSSVANGDALLT
jgi:uncharacterized protein